MPKSDYDICLEHLEEIRDFMIEVISEKAKENEECDVMLSDIMEKIDTEIDSKINSINQSKTNKGKGGSKRHYKKTRRRRRRKSKQTRRR